jgi:hypothetical protein
VQQVLTSLGQAVLLYASARLPQVFQPEPPPGAPTASESMDVDINIIMASFKLRKAIIQLF